MSRVDVLSRFPAMMIILDSHLFKLKFPQENNEEICPVKEILKTKPYKDYCIRSDLLYKFVNGMKLLVVPTAMYKNKDIKDAHQCGKMSML